MKQRGFVFAIPAAATLIQWLVIAFIIYEGATTFVFTGNAGAACIPSIADCKFGAVCAYTGNLPNLYSCIVPSNPVNQFQYFLNSLSLSTLFCSPSGILSGVCGTVLPLVAGLLVAVLAAMLLPLFGIVLPPIISGVLGFIVGFAFFNFLSFYWWIIGLASVAIYFLMNRK